MSRIGKIQITVPEKVETTFKDHVFTCKGQKGTLKANINKLVKVSIKDKSITVDPIDTSKEARSQWGTTRTIISNMVNGVSKGFIKTLEFNGVGYKAAVNGTTLNLNLGFSHPIDFSLPAGITAKVTKNVIEIEGSDKELVGLVASKVRSFREPEPYKGKGIKYGTETIKRKAGKAGGKGK